jgi:hypothetical protein
MSSSSKSKRTKRTKNNSEDSHANQETKQNTDEKTNVPSISSYDPFKNLMGTKKPAVLQETKTADELVKIAEEMYKQLKTMAKTDEKFLPLSDKHKLEIFREKLGYNEFMNEYPIMTRYMICMGQYSSKAFRRFLEKIRMTKHPPDGQREKGYMEDQWIRRQADYVRYLWEAYQKSHYNSAEAAWIWEDAYKNLKGEFDDFRNKYEELKVSTKEEAKKLNGESAKDLLERLQTGKQKLSDNDALILLQKLKEKAYERRHKNMLEELVKVVKQDEHFIESRGKGPKEEVVDKSKPTITIVESIDPSRMNEVPPNMRMTEEYARTLPGYSANVE